ncbi:hypothetical protein C8R41DRAFT_805042 [Lentinula lateritia]|uniref:Uncharacterized protein n=1 Tax=Lentinula lateritia TaxID=40482 RepID=A0ABQ8VYV0_9AGAR|nr:hypothetical protein C8R41DRAFT_805042 [Lentinula lateritia]
MAHISLNLNRDIHQRCFHFLTCTVLVPSMLTMIYHLHVVGICCSRDRGAGLFPIFPLAVKLLFSYNSNVKSCTNSNG